MGMDESWHKVYEKNAEKDLPDHLMSCWTKEDFDDLLITTKALLRDMRGKAIKTVLDIGCGPGHYCKILHDLGYDVTGVDYSAKTIDTAKKKHPDINFAQENGYALSFENQKFDLVITIGALQCVYDYKKFVTESARVAKQALIISTLYRHKKTDDPQKLVDKDLKRDSWPTRDFHPEELTAILENIGFRTRVIRQIAGKKLTDHFFIVAERNEWTDRDVA
ncbi:MAG: class I SAM-dependent methyltransferase [Candidatus Woesearchaeota archaeon]|jgi:2-polyprenyl-3-methyl-5-hydroxy-6-metoxy-1,4-benzoquinol methylase